MLVIVGLASLLGCQGLGPKQQQTQGPGQLTPSPASIGFGNVQIGTTQSIGGSVVNTGGSGITISQITVSGTGYSISGITAPVTLAVGQSANFNVSFAPTTAGSASGNIAFATTNGTTNIGLSGTGVAAGDLTTNPTSINFGTVVVGSTSPQTETLKNTGGSNLTVTAATVSGAGFSYAGLTLPLTLVPNQASTFSISFAPTVAGASSGNLSLTVSGSTTSVDIALSGTGVTPGTLTPTPTSVSFGSVQVGNSASSSETLTNTGGSSLTISAASASGAGFSLSGLTLPLTLNAGASTSFTVHFSPSGSGTFSGSVNITSTGSNPNLSIPLSGTGVTPGTLTPNPASMTFTNVQVGQSPTQTETLKNTGGSNVQISQVTASGTGFSVSGFTPPVTLPPGQSTSFSVIFTPPSAGNFSGSVSITSDASNSNLSVPLTGSAVGATQTTLSVTNPISVGSVFDGLSGTQSGTLTASGGTVSVSSVTLGGTNPAEFSISGLTFPVTVTTSQPVSFTVTFTPAASGAASATASFASNASNSPTVTTLTGTGTPAPVHTVSLSWVASATQGITSYNVYRAIFGGSSCGSYSNIGSTSGTVTTYTDNVVTDGTTYCYATTAVDPNGESVYSNIVQAKIPAP